MVQWLGIGFVMLCLVVPGELLRLFLPDQTVAAAVLLVTLGFCMFGAWFSRQLDVRHMNLSSDRLEQPLRVIQISDVHIGSRSDRFLKQVVDRINSENPDLVVITGDLVDSSSVDQNALSALGELTASCFFVPGNHDRWVDLDALVTALENLGVVVIRNSEVEVKGIRIIGIDDADNPRQVANVLPQIIRDSERFSILLYHRPHGWEDAVRYGIDLKLSGHTHNGQIFPFNYLVRRMFPRIVGLFERDGRWLYVSPGTGTWGPFLRIGSRNEITCFNLCPTVLSPRGERPAMSAPSVP